MGSSIWQIGDQLRVRGQRWTLRDLTAWPASTELRLSSPRRSAFTILTPFDRPTTAGSAMGIRTVHARRFLHVLRRAVAAATPYGGSIAAARAAVQLLSHQLEPLLAMVRHGIARVLVADAVGLGKTIQAGLILLELAAREAGFRALLLIPAGLKAQWRQELRDRFALEVEDADATWLRRAAADRPADVNPWSLPGIYLTSIDFAKRPEVLRSLEDTTWDLVVLDEAHAAAGASDRRRAAHALACRSRRVLLLTATPDIGDPAAFTALCNIGALDGHDAPVVMFRRAREDVVPGHPRRSVLLRVRPTPAEQRMHDLLDRYTRRVLAEASARDDRPARLATIVLRKRALSSASSLAVSAYRRQQLLGGAAPSPERQLLLPLADEDPLADLVEDDDLAAPGLADVREERHWLASIIEAARLAARAESKAARLARILDRISEPVIVFTEYRDTLERLAQLVRAAGRKTETMHGGMERGERERVQRAFNRGGRVLLATDAASEGLNLHHSCRIVVHYELPWRPARIEQRVGRIDRLGQTRRVHEIALVAAGTVERLVLAPLVARAARARISGGVAAGLLDSLSEAAVLELVMGGELRVPPGTVAAAPATRALDLRDEAAGEVSRLERSRAYLARSPPREPSHQPSIVLCRLRRVAKRMEWGVVAVFAISLTDTDGRSLHSELVPLRLDAPPSHGLRGRAVHELCASVRRWAGESGHPLYEAVTRLAVEVEGRVATMHRSAAIEMTRRDEGLRRTQPSAAAAIVQAGLFDRRAVVAHARATAVRGALLEGIDARLQRQAASEPLEAQVELVAVLSIPRQAR